MSSPSVYLLACLGRAFVVIDGDRHSPLQARARAARNPDDWDTETNLRILDFARRADLATYVPALPDVPTGKIEL